MGRLPPPKREELPEDGQRVWDQIAGPRGGMGAVGPYGVLVRHPALAERVEALGSLLRFGGTLPGADRELAILTAGRELGARFEWYAHEPIARREGARDVAIAAVRERAPLDGLTPREQVIIASVRALYRDRALPDGLYARALAELGETGLIELVTLAGYYGLIGFVLLGFAVEPPEGSTTF